MSKPFNANLRSGGSCRVLRVITRLNIGGPGQHVLTLTKALPELAGVVACGRPDTDEGELDTSGVEIIRVPLVRPLSPPRDVLATAAIRRLISHLAPDIVESHMAKAGFTARLAALSLKKRPATVHVLHGHVFDGYFSAPVTKALIAVERLLSARTDLLITVSDQTRDSLLSLGIGRPERYRVVPLGFDLSAFTAVSGHSGVLRHRLGLGSDTPLIGVAARLVPIKDHATLLAALAHVPDAHLAVLGDGPLRYSLEERAEVMGIGRRVHFLGWWSDMPAGFADCDVVALSSRNEGTPVSLIEAMAVGKPVVATDVGGTASVVDEATTGFLVPPGDPAALGERLNAVLSDCTMARSLGSQGRMVATERFGIERLLRDMRVIYSELLAGRSA